MADNLDEEPLTLKKKKKRKVSNALLGSESKVEETLETDQPEKQKPEKQRPEEQKPEEQKPQKKKPEKQKQKEQKTQEQEPDAASRRQKKAAPMDPSVSLFDKLDNLDWFD